MVMPLSLSDHIIENLILKLTCINGSRLLKKPVGKSALAMINMCYYAEVSYVVHHRGDQFISGANIYILTLFLLTSFIMGSLFHFLYFSFLHKQEQMITLAVSVALLILGYLVYGRVAERLSVWTLERPTPAFTQKDGMITFP